MLTKWHTTSYKKERIVNMFNVSDYEKEVVVKYHNGSGFVINDYDIDEMSSAFLPSQEDMDEYYELVNEEN